MQFSGYSPLRFAPDLVAGVALAAYAIPVSLAYRTLAGLPPAVSIRISDGRPGLCGGGLVAVPGDWSNLGDILMMADVGDMMATTQRSRKSVVSRNPCAAAAGHQDSGC